MAIDPRYGNSSGYFKDPTNDQDLTSDMPRLIPCSLEGGKFTWPCVLSSDGTMPLKIVFRLFTPEEKELYNTYRGRSPSGSKPRAAKPKAVKQKQEPESEEPVQVIKHDENSAVALKTLETLACCDRLFGVSQIAGITYVLCGTYGSNVVHHIPRALVPDEEFKRLNEGMA